MTEEQTEGRGRLGRRWLSPPGVSLLFSILLEPQVETARASLSFARRRRGLRGSDSCRYGNRARDQAPERHPGRGRKIAGILAEAREGRVVLGIG